MLKQKTINMIKYYVVRLIFFFTIISMPFGEIKAHKSQIDSYPFEEILIRKIPANLNINKTPLLKDWMIGTFDELHIKGLQNQNLILSKGEMLKIYKYGNVSSYQVKLEGDFPTGIQKTFTLILNLAKNEACLFPLDVFKPICVTTDKSISIAGIMSIRGKDFFLIYQLRGNDRFVLALSTLDFCEFGIPVGVYTDECIGYKHDKLNISYQDQNGDHVEDVIFSGIVEYYCKPGVDRNEQQHKPIKIETVSITFLSATKDSSFNWVLINKDICRKIPNN